MRYCELKEHAYGRDRLRSNRERRSRGEFVHILIADYGAHRGVIGYRIKLGTNGLNRSCHCGTAGAVGPEVTHDGLNPRLRVIGNNFYNTTT